ncbi:hypothetical protein OEZ85_013468 [Tetradesmus obliquus]|uniref:Beta-glucuronidase C-terminal domain-containing protein n=1 Tax=Tetradesmus obliquus TaxID=3088 RepID=A0ABY8UR24_TETOB|nr:hypothetical protein OEZ85_013468 [Tetradesmus obliquus]
MARKQQHNNHICLILLLGLAAASAGLAQQQQAPAFTTVTMLDIDSPGKTIPQSFMGFSHEWPYVEELYTIPQYMDIIKLLQSFGSGPLVLRVGGGSTDKLTTVPGPEVWGPLSKLHAATGMKYILGLNLFLNDVALARKQMDAAKAGLPASSIISFEIGNEPDYYFNKPSTHWNGTKLVAGWNGTTDYLSCCFHTEWYAMAEALSCRNGPSSCEYGQFTGPVWGHLNLRNTTMDWFLKTNGKWVEMTSVHWYKATSETFNTPVTLLDEVPIRKEMTNLKEIVRVSEQVYGKPLRVAEMNTISNSGRDGVSNVFAAALWTLDASLEVAAAGGVGVNFHQGAGQNLYAAIIRWYDNGRLALPQLRPPFFGMLLFQMAVRGGSRLMGTQVTHASDANNSKFLKVWALQDVQTGELRWVIINKDASRAASAVLWVNRPSGYASEASVIRMTAAGPNPLSATSGITVAGVSYGLGGAKSGERRIEAAKVSKNAKGGQMLTVQVPAGSAALVRLPLAKEQAALRTPAAGSG